MVTFVNHADTISKRYSDINDNFEELAAGGGGSGGDITSDQITDATAVGKDVLTAADAAAARTAIGAGTSTLNLSLTAPVALAATAAVGAGTTAARNDHVHPFPAQLATGRTIALSGGAVGTSTAFTGAANLTIATTLTAATGGTRGAVFQGAAVANATSETDVVAQFNALLASLRTTGIIST